MIFFLPLHAPVLEPDLDLALGESEGVGDLDAPTTGEVAVVVKLLLQLEGLVASVCLTSSLLLEPEVYLTQKISRNNSDV